MASELAKTGESLPAFTPLFSLGCAWPSGASRLSPESNPRGANHQHTFDFYAEVRSSTTYIQPLVPSLGRHRNVEQDVAFGIQQLVDIALKALSPGINDTTTAIMAIDYIGAIVGRLAEREFPARLRADGGQLRVLVRASDFEGYVRLAFDLPRINAKGNHAVFRRLLRALAGAAQVACHPDRHRIIDQQAQLLLEAANQTLTTDYEKQSVQTLYGELKAVWQ